MHRRHNLSDLIDVAMSDAGPFTVRVTDRGPVESANEDPGETTADGRFTLAAAGRLRSSYLSGASPEDRSRCCWTFEHLFD